MKFDLEFYKQVDIKDSIILKFKKIEGSTSIYREICQQILNQSNL